MEPGNEATCLCQESFRFSWLVAEARQSENVKNVIMCEVLGNIANPVTNVCRKGGLTLRSGPVRRRAWVQWCIPSSS